MVPVMNMQVPSTQKMHAHFFDKQIRYTYYYLTIITYKINVVLLLY